MSDTTTVAPENNPEIEIPSEEPRVSAELLAKVHTCRAFAECHNLIARGQFNIKDFQAAATAINFLSGLYRASVQDAVKEKGAWTIPELREFMETGKKDAAKAAEASDVKV